MGKTKLGVLALCLGAWVNPVSADTSGILEAKFSKLFQRISLAEFERELMNDVRNDDQDAIMTLIEANTQEQDVSARISAAAKAGAFPINALMEEEYQNILHRDQDLKALAQSIESHLAATNQKYRRPEAEAFTVSVSGKMLDTLKARADSSTWVTKHGWFSSWKTEELAFSLIVDSEHAEVCATDDVVEPTCTSFDIDTQELISYSIEPNGKHVGLPGPVAERLPTTASGPDAKVHSGESSSGF